MRTFFLNFFCIFSAATVYAAQTCKTESAPASTPDSQLIDNSDGTVTDLNTGLMWKKCLEGVSGDTCENGMPISSTWQQALQRPRTINSEGGFAGHADWRLPNIKELISLVEDQCYDPGINLNRFPNTPSLAVWSGSPYAAGTSYAWFVGFVYGYSSITNRDVSYAVRLVRGGE